MSENKKDTMNQTGEDGELPVLPLRNLVLFPGAVLSVEVGRRSSLRLLDEVSRNRPPRLLVAVQKDPQTEEPEADDLHPVVVEAEVLKLIRFGPDRVTAVLRGVKRHGMKIVHLEPYLLAKIQPFNETLAADVGQKAQGVRDAAQRLVELSPEAGRSLGASLEGLTTQKAEPTVVADVIASHLDLPVAEQLAVLFQGDVKARLEMVATQLKRQMEVIELKARIDSQVQDEMSRQQRETVLRQRMKAIKEELGEEDGDSDLDQFDDRIKQAKMTEEAEKAARRQLSRLRGMPTGSAEYTVQRTYLEWLCDVPWSKRTEDKTDLQAARDILEADHHGIAKVKKRILEYLAVRKLAPNKKGPILCLAGPPGVGKTSLGQSIARAMERKFVRISLGGVRDEAEIRGHRRTYIGAIPGRIVQALKQAGAMNPVFMLDEIDKISVGYQGDPAAALLEVLDPAQNSSFRDHYLEINIDLSKVLFIATSNQLGTIHPALLDRMEIIQLAGYSDEDKLHIATRYLVPRQLQEHGLTPEQMSFDEAAIRRITSEYTREAGVRSLERQVGTVARKIAARVASASTPPAPIAVHADDVPEFLGPPRFLQEVAFRVSRPGVATGVAWTEVGGDVLFVEASLLPGGNHNLILTGQLGNVMQESARAALSHIRSRAVDFGIDVEAFAHQDLHVHVPAGAIPKDGPSAGVTIATAIVSALRNQTVRADVAMTGEITLSGLVLPVGGIREKALAAKRFGIKTFILPSRNQPDLAELPAEVKEAMQFVPAETLDDVLAVALLKPVASA